MAPMSWTIDLYVNRSSRETRRILCRFRGPSRVSRDSSLNSQPKVTCFEHDPEEGPVRPGFIFHELYAVQSCCGS